MPSVTVCLKCGSRIRTPDSLAGKKTRCPRCDGILLIPERLDDKAPKLADDIQRRSPTGRTGAPRIRKRSTALRFLILAVCIGVVSLGALGGLAVWLINRNSGIGMDGNALVDFFDDGVLGGRRDGANVAGQPDLDEPLFSRNRDFVDPGRAVSVPEENGLVAAVRVGKVSRALLAPNGQTLAISTVDRYFLIDVATSRVVQIQGWGLLAFSPNSELLATQLYKAEDNLLSVVLVDSRTGEEKRTVKELGTPNILGCTGAQFSPDGRFFTAVIQEEKRTALYLWKCEAWRDDPKLLMATDRFSVEPPLFTPDSTTVVVSTGVEEGGYGVQLFDVKTGAQKLLGQNASNRPKHPLAFTPDGKTLVCSNDGSTSYWDTKSHTEQADFAGPHLGFSKVLYSPDGKYFASLSGFNELRLWDARTGQQLVLRDREGGISLTAFSADSRLLLVVHGELVKAWDVVKWVGR